MPSDASSHIPSLFRSGPKGREAASAAAATWTSSQASGTIVPHDNDAGTVREELLPPMYDPSWDSNSRGESSVSGRNAGARSSVGASVGYPSSSSDLSPSGGFQKSLPIWFFLVCSREATFDE
jgi:hypothetical protein